MKLLVTGGAGFVGARLARTLLGRGALDGRAITRLVLADQVAPPADLLHDARVEARTGALLPQCAALAGERFDGVFHLASAVSGECEADFELGLRSNLDTTRALLDALRAGGNAPRLVFSSSVAVFGPDPAHPMPSVVGDDTLPAPQTSYGTHKLVCEHLVADYTRKGYIDGRSARLMTVTVRPGRPNGAASSFFSGIIREPLAGEDAICPVAAEVSHPVSSPARTVQGLIAVYEADRGALLGRSALNLPALNVTVAQMLDALEAVAGREVRARVRFERDERIAGIVSNWPAGASAQRAARLGLAPELDFRDIVRQYIADCEATGLQATALRGLPAMNRIDLAGRVAIVTGGAQGIGLAIARRFLASGATVLLWDNNEAALAQANGALDAPGRVGTRVVELSEDAAVAAAAAAAIAGHGRIDVLVNNAGITGGNGTTWELAPEVWRRVIEVNLVAPYLTCRAVVPHMLERGTGRIVNVASVAGKEGNPNASHYSASKAGLIALTKSLGKELAARGILVTAVAPAAARTPIFDQMTPAHIEFMLGKIPMGRFAEADEIAAMVAWLASDDCSFSTGAVFDLSGGRATY